MNRDFEKRSKTVFQALSLLVKIEPRIVFLGGSAIQALFEKPKRLSIDLDISYPGEVNALIKSLEDAGYAVKERSSRSPNFLFYTISKDEVMVKLDIGRFAIPETETHKVYGKAVLIPKKCYFLAAKLSSLAFGTIGRFEFEPTQVIKDIFDIDCLLELGVDLNHMGKDFLHIISDQNRLRNSQFSEVQCAESVQSVLLKCIEVTPLPDFFIPQSALGSFEEFLVRGKIKRQELATMAARALLLLVDMDGAFYDIEKAVISESGNPEKLNEAELILVQKGLIDPKQIRALKIIAPKALIYLKYWSEKKEAIKR
jgi:hypothetical protein